MTRSLLSIALLLTCLPAAQADDAELALNGLDPVALALGKEVAGKPELTATAFDLEFRFASEESRAKFLADPKAHGPAIGGDCPACVSHAGHADIWTVYRGRIYLGCAESCLDDFLQRPEHFLGQREARRRVAILVFPGVQLLDYTGPYEVLAGAGFDVFTVSTSTDAIETNSGMRLVPHHSLAEAPEADIVVLPGGGVGHVSDEEAVQDWVRRSCARAELVLSVCNGAFFLAEIGLLDGLQATTYHALIDDLERAAPAAEIVRDRRYCDNGKYVISAGISAGIDGAFRIVEKTLGHGRAQQLALGLEYDWRPGTEYARASFADLHIRRALSRELPLPEGATAQIVDTRGDTREWCRSWLIEGDASVDAVREAFQTRLAQHWAADGSHSGAWRFLVGDAPWRGSLEVAAKDGSVLVTISVNAIEEARGQ
ncbi:MAG: DJ-1/PfpI family protein [Planctomycetota bacterium]